MNRNAPKIILYIKIGILLAGIIFLCIVVGSTIQIVHKVKTYNQVEGIVTELVRKDNYYYPVITFTTLANEEIEYIPSSGQNPPNHRVGNKVELLYDTDNPYRVIMNNFEDRWATRIIFSIIGLICTGMGVIMVRGDIISAKNKKRLLKINHVLKSKQLSIEKNDAISYNGRTPWVIYAMVSHPLDSRMHQYQSDNIWFDPTEFVPKEMNVYIDPQDSHIGYVDLSEIPQISH